MIHYARHWNPAKKDQATDRAYRIGQEKTVHVYYPMATAPDFNSFDVTLNELLARKRELADASLFPSEKTEVNPTDVADDVLDLGGIRTNPQRLRKEEIDTLDPHLFEAYVAALWRKNGYRVRLTPKQQDRGADVVAISDETAYLLQVKQTKQSVGSNAVGEILKARGSYEQLLDHEFALLIVTNGRFTREALETAADNGIKTLGRSALYDMHEQLGVSLADVQTAAHKRMSSLQAFRANG